MAPGGPAASRLLSTDDALTVGRQEAPPLLLGFQAHPEAGACTHNCFPSCFTRCNTVCFAVQGERACGTLTVGRRRRRRLILLGFQAHPEAGAHTGSLVLLLCFAVQVDRGYDGGAVGGANFA